jgi:hypothetical protein
MRKPELDELQAVRPVRMKLEDRKENALHRIREYLQRCRLPDPVLTHKTEDLLQPQLRESMQFEAIASRCRARAELDQLWSLHQGEATRKNCWQ